MRDLGGRGWRRQGGWKVRGVLRSSASQREVQTQSLIAVRPPQDSSRMQSKAQQALTIPGGAGGGCRYFTERLIRTCAELPKVCEFFHVPFQSGDDDILREMKRGYTAERYRRIMDNIRRHMPDASLSGDAIVGFPGETEDQFERTVQLVREVGFDRVNTAAYSPRPNTPAAERPDQAIPPLLPNPLPSVSYPHPLSHVPAR